MSLRSSPTTMAEAIKDRKEGSRLRQDFDAFFDILLDIREALELTKTELFEVKRRMEASGEMTPEALRAYLSINPMVRYVRYTSDTQNLVHVLNKPTECAIWGRFIEAASEDKNNQALIFFTMKGGINMVITNVPLIIPPGIVHHVIKSASDDIPDVVMFRAEHSGKFFYPHFLKG